MLHDVVNFIEHGVALPASATVLSQPEKEGLPLDQLLDWALKDLNPYGHDDLSELDPSALKIWRDWSQDLIAYWARKATLYKQLAQGKTLAPGQELEHLGERLVVAIRGNVRPRSVNFGIVIEQGYERLIILMDGDQIDDRPDSPRIQCATINHSIKRSDIYELTFLGDRIATFEDKRQYLDERLPEAMVSFSYSKQARNELESN